MRKSSAPARDGKRVSPISPRALAREIGEHEVDFTRLAAPYRRMFKGPRDLSSREGYGIKTIVDAGPLIGWLNASDQWHE